jgi:hypothetical protein
MVDIFSSDMFKMASLTDAVGRMPNLYNRIESLGLFPDRGSRHRTVGVEELNEIATLLPTLAWGAPGTPGSTDKRGGYAFNIPHIPHVDVVSPEDVQSVREFGSEDALRTAATAVANKQRRMKNKIDLTREYMRATALAGTAKDGAGATLYAYYTAFGITQKVVDFALGTATTDVRGKCAEVFRHLEDNAKGAAFSGVGALCSPAWFDKFVKHAKVEEAFKYFNTTQPLSGDFRRGFTFGGVTFVEYNATVTLADGSTTAAMITSGDVLFYPLGAAIGVMVNAPANYMETVNTIGQPYYSKSEPKKFGKGVDLEVQSNPLPILLRPDLVVRGHSSN